MTTANTKTQGTQAINDVQLNIVTYVDVQKATANHSADGCVYMMDNSPSSLYKGTAGLQTFCKQGQVLNWIIYAMDMDQRPDGSWPPSVKINNVVFLDESGDDVALIRVIDELKILGGPDKIRSPYTPVYYYWAGIVEGDLPVGIYKYRFVLELEPENPAGKSIYLNMDGQSLNVLSAAG